MPASRCYCTDRAGKMDGAVSYRIEGIGFEYELTMLHVKAVMWQLMWVRGFAAAASAVARVQAPDWDGSRAECTTGEAIAA